jgi:hypothetical protein
VLKFFSHPKTQVTALALWACMLPFWNLGMSVAMFFLLFVSIVVAVQKKKFLLLPVLRNPIYLSFRAKGNKDTTTIGSCTAVFTKSFSP